MLPKKNRLSLQEGLFLKNKKLVWQGQLLNIFIHPNSSLLPRVAIVITKRIAVSSVARHKIKRHLAETIYPHLNTLPPLKILIYVKERITKAAFLKIEEEVAATMKSLSRIL